MSSVLLCMDTEFTFNEELDFHESGNRRDLDYCALKHDTPGSNG